MSSSSHDRQLGFGRIHYLSAELREGSLTYENLADLSLRELVELHRFEIGEIKTKIGNRIVEIFFDDLDSLLMVYRLVGEPTLRQTCFDRALKLVVGMNDSDENMAEAYQKALTMYKQSTGTRRDKALKVAAGFAQTFLQHMELFSESTDPEMKEAELDKCAETAGSFAQMFWVRKQSLDARKSKNYLGKCFEMLMAAGEEVQRENLRAFIDGSNDPEKTELALRFYIGLDWYKLQADEVARADEAARLEPYNEKLQLAAQRVDAPNDDFLYLLARLGGNEDLEQALCRRVIEIESQNPWPFKAENLRLVWGYVSDPDLKRVAGMLVNKSIKHENQEL